MLGSTERSSQIRTEKSPLDLPIKGLLLASEQLNRVLGSRNQIGELRSGRIKGLDTANVNLSMEGIKRWQILNYKVRLRGVLR